MTQFWPHSDAIGSITHITVAELVRREVNAAKRQEKAGNDTTLNCLNSISLPDIEIKNIDLEQAMSLKAFSQQLVY